MVLKGQAASMIAVFVIALVGIGAVVPTILSTITSITTLNTVTNETFTPPAATQQNLSISLDQATGGISSITLVENTSIIFGAVTDCSTSTEPFNGRGNYTLSPVDSSAIVICKHSGTGVINISYVGQPEGYIESSANRNILENIPLFFGIVVLLFTVGLFAIRRT